MAVLDSVHSSLVFPTPFEAGQMPISVTKADEHFPAPHVLHYPAQQRS